jgi:hypothetical protein
MNRQFRLIVRFLDTSARVHLRSSFLSSPKSFKDLFPLSVQYRSVTREAPRGGLLASPVQRQRRALLHLTYNIETSSCDGASFRAHIIANVGCISSCRFIASCYLVTRKIKKSTNISKRTARQLSITACWKLCLLS